MFHVFGMRVYLVLFAILFQVLFLAVFKFLLCLFVETIIFVMADKIDILTRDEDRMQIKCQALEEAKNDFLKDVEGKDTVIDELEATMQGLQEKVAYGEERARKLKDHSCNMKDKYEATSCHVHDEIKRLKAMIGGTN